MHCVASNCFTCEGQGVKLFCFPRDAARRALWTAKVNRYGWKPTKSSCLCEKHFTLDQFEFCRRDNVQNLQPFAVPTLFDYTSTDEPVTVCVESKPLNTVKSPPNNSRCMQSSESVNHQDNSELSVTNTKPVTSSVTASETVIDDMEPADILSTDVSAENPRLKSLVQQMEMVQKQKDALFRESKEFYIMKERVRQLMRDIDTKQTEIQKEIAQRAAKEKLIEDQAVELCAGDVQKWKNVLVELKDSKPDLINAPATLGSLEQSTTHAVPIRVNGPLVLSSANCLKLETTLPSVDNATTLTHQPGESFNPPKHCSAAQFGMNLLHKDLSAAVPASVLPISNAADEVGASPSPSTSSSGRVCAEPSSGENSSCKQSTVDEIDDDTGATGSLEIDVSPATPVCGGLKSRVRVSRNTGEIFLCDLCGESFTVKRKWQYHVNGHDKSGNVKKFACLICNKLFINSYRLRVHERTHTGECPYVCQECGRSFYKNELLMLHRRTHSDERPSVCKTCSATFKRRDRLHRHVIMEHEPHRLLVCALCDGRFVLPCHLRNHMEKVHSGDKQKKPSEARSRKRKRLSCLQASEMTCELSCHEEIVVYVGDGLENESIVSGASQNHSESE